MNWEEFYILKSEKRKNNRMKSSYIHLYNTNRHREKALITFTVTRMSQHEKLAYMADIKRYVAKRLNNLNAKVKYFSVIELGEKLNNPHLHLQIFFDKETESKIIQVYLKTIEEFHLNEKRCKLTMDDKKLKMKSSINYTIKEFDNTKLSDKEIIALYRARKALKVGKNRGIRFYSSSRLFQPMSIYRTFFRRFDLNFMAVDQLFQSHILTKFSRSLLPRFDRGSENTPAYIFCGKHVVRFQLMKE